METKFCHSCGTEISGSPIFCHSCGIKLIEGSSNFDNNLKIQKTKKPQSHSYYLDPDKIINASLLSENSILINVTKIYDGANFEEVKYALLESKHRDIVFNKTLKRTIIREFEGFFSDKIFEEYIEGRKKLEPQIKSISLELIKEEVINCASDLDIDLVSKFQSLKPNPSFNDAKYILLEMESRNMVEFKNCSNSTYDIHYFNDTKENYLKIKLENELAIDLKKTNKRLDRYEKDNQNSSNEIKEKKEEILLGEDTEEYVEPPKNGILNSSFSVIITIILVLIIFVGLVFYSGNTRKVESSNSVSNECTGVGSQSCIDNVRQNFSNTGKTILGEQYLGDGRFGISFMDSQHPGAYNATISTDCKCNITSSNVSTMR
jgi:hypothetical protein